MGRTIKRAVFGPVALGLVAFAVVGLGFWIQLTGQTVLRAPLQAMGLTPVGLATKVGGGLGLLALLWGALRPVGGPDHPAVRQGVDSTDPFADLGRPTRWLPDWA